MRIMPKIIHDPLDPSEGIELPTIRPNEWIAGVEKLIGQSLNKAEKVYAAEFAEKYNWTATVVADHLRLNRAAPDLLKALKSIAGLKAQGCMAAQDIAIDAITKATT